MKLLNPVKILLLLYLSTAVLFPSYQHSENSLEFHFFGILEPHAEYHHHSTPEIEASHDRDHSHSLIHFYPVQRLQRLNSNSENCCVLFIPATEFSVKTSWLHIHSLSFQKTSTAIVFEKKASGLSPPTSLS